MNIAKGVRIEGYRIHCDVVELPGGQYRLVVASHQEGRPDTERAWQVPDWEPCSQLAEAQRRAGRLLKSIKRVGACGEPLYGN
ncbi:hypothetical protein [Bordetella petrii]|uniref:hypothetical protein n=1 Tax=Bordetella petrii TaxID=94624 RepID=UPI001A96DEA8|nr:hypothetical protein [Bordetella petrii]MBO1113035.1 hypothetical protein [Bordetella petrii]